MESASHHAPGEPCPKFKNMNEEALRHSIHKYSRKTRRLSTDSRPLWVRPGGHKVFTTALYTIEARVENSMVGKAMIQARYPVLRALIAAIVTVLRSALEVDAIMYCTNGRTNMGEWPYARALGHRSGHPQPQHNARASLLP